jgi:hypothetical protein
MRETPRKIRFAVSVPESDFPCAGEFARLATGQGGLSPQMGKCRGGCAVVRKIARKITARKRLVQAYFLRGLRAKVMRDLPMKLERILAATDLSETSRSGLRYAMNMALERDAELVVLYVIGEDAQSGGGAAPRIRAAASGIHPGDMRRLAQRDETPTGCRSRHSL